MIKKLSMIDNRVLLIVFVLGFAIRLVVFIGALNATPNDPTVFYNTDDTHSYISPLMGLIYTGRFESAGKPEILRTPGYPIFMLPGALLGNMEYYTVLFQIVLSSLTILLVYLGAWLIFENVPEANFAAALYAVEPMSIIQSSVLQTETLFAFLLMVFVVLMLRYFRTGSARAICLAGLVAAVCAYVRPLAYYMPVYIAIVLAILYLLKRDFSRKRLVHFTLFLLVAMAPLFLWQVRNYIVSGFYGFSVIAGKDLYFDAGVAILASKAGVNFYDQKKAMGYGDDETYFRLHPEQREWPYPKIADFQQKEAIRIILNHPYEFIKMFALRSGWTMVGPGVGDWLYVFNVQSQGMQEVLKNRKDPLKLLKGPVIGLSLTVFFSVMLFSYWGLAIVGVLSERNYLNDGIIFIILISVYYICLPAAAGVGYSRFRHPVMPLMCILGGYGIHAVQDWWNRRIFDHAEARLR